MTYPSEVGYLLFSSILLFVVILCLFSFSQLICLPCETVLFFVFVFFFFMQHKKYLFDEFPTHRKFNVLVPERVLKMKRIDFGEYSLIPIVSSF